MMSPEFKSEIKSHWGKLDANSRKLAIFLPCLLLALFIATHPHPFRRTAMQMQPRAIPVRPAAALPGIPGADAGASASSALQSPGAFAGKWQGKGNVAKQGLCTLQLEVRQDERARFLAYPALQCLPLPAYFVTGKPEQNPAAFYMDMLAKANPSTAILSGNWRDGSVVFQVDKVTASDSGCAMTGFTLTPFGSSEVTAQWTDKCGGGSLLLMRLPTPRGMP